MAHKEQMNFFSDLSQRFPDNFYSAVRILEIGSQNINGTVRDFFPNANQYLGIDLAVALDVDWVVPGELLELPDGWADIIISTECFEHCENWEKVLLNMIRICKSSGLIIITCASTGRAAHGTIDSDKDSSPFTTSYYKNIGMDDITQRIIIEEYFIRHAFEANSISNDLYFWGIRSSAHIQNGDYYWQDPLTRLSRAQGQLAQAAARHSAIESELKKIVKQAEEANSRTEEANKLAEEADARAVESRQILDQIINSNTWRTITKIKKLAGLLKFLKSKSFKRQAAPAPAPAKIQQLNNRSVAYNQDGLNTSHNSSFLNDAHFKLTYEYTKCAVGHDYQWHWRNYIGIKLASLAKDYNLNFVECGVGQGWMTISIIHYMQEKFGITPYFTLFDTWEGIDETLVSPEEELFWGQPASEKKKMYKYTDTPFDVVKQNILNAARLKHKINFVKGSIPNTFSTNVLDKIQAQGEISFLHIDMNNSYPEVQALTVLYPFIARGGIILFDDYAYSGYEFQQQKIDEACDAIGIERPIFLPTGQGLHIKT
jgi:SAM-dependent methyltransferase